jgi:hypothetical protein
VSHSGGGADQAEVGDREARAPKPPVSVRVVVVPATRREREFFIDNLLARIHLIIEMILVDRPCAMGV